MANIKFSQFTQKTTLGTVDFLVGYTGAQNIQIDPVDLLSGYSQGTGAAGQVAFFSAASTITGTNNLFFDSATISLGVGVSNPPKNFTVAWSSADTNVDGGNGLSGGTAGRGLLIRNNDTTLNTYANLDFRANSADGRIAYTHNGTNDGDFHFITDNFNNTGTRLFIGNTGNVGIGTVTPAEKLEVAGNIGINQYILHNNDLNTFFGFPGNDTVSIGTNGVERMRVDSSGNVGIGTTSPTTKLEVNGGVGVGTTGGTFLVRQKGDTSSDGIALTSSNGTSHRIFKTYNR